jgi:hypothetical protein
LGYHTSTSRNSTNEYYDISYTFFRERARRPKIDVSLARTENGRVGFQVTVRRSGIRNPYVECNGTEYLFEKQNHDDENVFLQVNTYYSSYPFAIKQDHSKGAYIIQLNRKLREVEKFDTTIQASIHIRGEGFEMEKDYVLTSNLLDLRTKRLNSKSLFVLKTLHSHLKKLRNLPYGVGFCHHLA